MFADRRDTLKSPLKLNAQPLNLVELIFNISTNTNTQLTRRSVVSTEVLLSGEFTTEVATTNNTINNRLNDAYLATL